MPDTGRISPNPKPRKRPLLSPLERYNRGRQIAALRGRVVNGELKPVAWREIAREVGMTAKGASEAYAQWLEWEMPLHDPLEVVQETINALTVSMHEAFRTVEASPLDSSVRVQSIRVGMQAAITRLNVMRAAGRAPRSLEGPRAAQQMQAVLREFAELLSRHEVSDEVLREFLELAESTMGRVSAIEGRELTSAA